MQRAILCILMAVTLSLSSKAEVKVINDIWDIQYNKRPIIIDAYASWCGPCKMYSPIVESMARKYSGKVDFYKVDVDDPDSEDFVLRYEINSVPTTVILWDETGDATVKERVERGFMNREELEECIRFALSKQYTVRHSQTIDKTWDSRYEDLAVYTDFPNGAESFIGEWQATDNGDESRVFFFREGDELRFLGGTASGRRQNLVGTKYWLALGMDWDPADCSFTLCDVLPDRPSKITDMPKSGELCERVFRYKDGNIVMAVTTYSVVDNRVDMDNPTEKYEIVYNRFE